MLKQPQETNRLAIRNINVQCGRENTKGEMGKTNTFPLNEFVNPVEALCKTFRVVVTLATAASTVVSIVLYWQKITVVVTGTKVIIHGTSQV